jgi:hypothetical protein
MATPRKGFQQKVEELKMILEHYGGIPSQQQDRAAYANICYYLKTYGDAPEIKELISKFNLNVSKRGKRTDAEAQISNIAAILRDKGRIPSVNDDESLYAKIRYTFNKYKDIAEVIKLKYVYAHSSCYPLPDSKYGPKPKEENQNLNFYAGYIPEEIAEWLDNTAYEYIEYVYKNFGELPASETRPMIRLKKHIDRWYRYNVDCSKSERTRLYEFLHKMIDVGCEKAFIKEAYYSFKFDNEQVQERIRQMVIENGACAIHYIAQTVIPESVLSDEFVYYYYYVKFNDKTDNIGQMPLGELYSGVHPYRVLRVHYRDYNKCDIDKIRVSAKTHYRNWRDLHPESLDEWKYYGQSEFFANKEDSFYAQVLGEYNSSIDWSTTYIEKQQIKGAPYFRFYKNRDRYIDYCNYLIESGYTPQDKVLLDSLSAHQSKDNGNDE